MFRFAAGPAIQGSLVRPMLGAVVIVLGCTLSEGVRADPPIMSAQDAACRNVARSQVFSAPDPYNLGLRELGRRIYQECMGSSGKKPVRKKRHRRRR